VYVRTSSLNRSAGTGFTLIELSFVMLILESSPRLPFPCFLNQRARLGTPPRSQILRRSARNWRLFSHVFVVGAVYSVTATDRCIAALTLAATSTL